MPFPNVPRKSNVAAATFDLRAYVKELIQALALGIKVQLTCGIISMALELRS